MSTSRPPASPPTAAPELVAYVLALLPLAALGTLSGGAPFPPLIVAFGGVGLSLAIAAGTRGRYRAWAPLPTIGAAAFVAISALPGVISESLAGAAGLLIVFAVAQRREEARPIAEVAPALSLPIVAVGLALACAVILPGIPGATGAAAALLVFVFLFLAWLYSRSDPAAEVGSATS